MKMLGVIPARYKSSRFPGKPLQDICGKPMIVRVWERASKCSELSDLCVATDDDRIQSACDQHGIKCIMTSDACRTGTDRVAEVAKRISADFYINIQGDEPLIDPPAISEFLLGVTGRHHVYNSMIEIKDPLELINPTVPKVAATPSGRAVYLSRAPIPFPKSPLAMSGQSYFKQLGLYAFSPDALEIFASTPEGYLEAIEGIEILRFIESEDWNIVRMIRVHSDSIAVDTPDDLVKVCRIWQERGY